MDPDGGWQMQLMKQQAGDMTVWKMGIRKHDDNQDDDGSGTVKETDVA